MKKHDILSILITFSAGAIVGVYLYTTGLPMIMSDRSVPDVEEMYEFSIVGEFYGGCGTTCPSFQVVGDGSYRYFYTPEATGQELLSEGILPFKIRQNLNKAISEKSLTVQSEQIERENCVSYADGSDLKYVVTLDNVEYDIDSCYTAVDGQGELWVALSEMWSYYSTR